MPPSKGQGFLISRVNTPCLLNMRKRASCLRSRPFLNQEILGYTSGNGRKGDHLRLTGDLAGTCFYSRGSHWSPHDTQAGNEQGADGDCQGPLQAEAPGPEPRGTERRERLGRGPLVVGASEPCLLSRPGPGPQALYLGATPDSTAEGSIVAGDD